MISVVLFSPFTAFCLLSATTGFLSESINVFLTTVKEDVEAGSTFAAALRRHPKIFADLYVNLVVAGEEGGILDNILLRLSNYIEKSVALKKKVKSALVYPTAILGVAVLVVAILMIFAVMLTTRMTDVRVRAQNEQVGVGAVVAAVLFVALSVAIWGTRWPESDLPMAADNIRSLGRLIMTEFVLPFEIVSVLLLAAMIGAIVIASKEQPAEPEREGGTT